MKCEICGRRFKQDDRVVPVLRYVASERRDFVTSQPNGYVHVHHLKEQRSTE